MLLLERVVALEKCPGRELRGQLAALVVGRTWRNGSLLASVPADEAGYEAASQLSAGELRKRAGARKERAAM
mgnify:CR=1 FL=1